MAALDRIKRHLEAFIEVTVGRRLRYGFVYPGTVVAQAVAPNNTVEVLLDDSRMRGTGHQAITVRHGIPGVLARMATGQRVALAFGAGDPGQPFILAYDEGSTATTQLDVNAQTRINLGSVGGTLRKAARQDDRVRTGSINISTSAPGVVLFVYLDDIGSPLLSFTLQVVTGVLTLTPIPPFVATLPFRGYIYTGSSKVYAED